MVSTFNLNKTTVSDMENRVDDWAVTPLLTDAAQGLKETHWTNPKGSTYWGYFNSIPDLKSAITMKAIWTVGKGYVATDAEVATILDHVSGWGKDTFDDILFNMVVCMRVFGDAFAEIIRADNKDKTLLNLKVIDPMSMRIVVNERGRIKRYEQINKNANGKVDREFQPEEILHFAHNRFADQIHGISDIEALEETIKAEAESFADLKKLNHRQARPFFMFKLKTDDQAKIDEFIRKMDSATNLGENVYIPDDDNAVSVEVVQLNPSQIVLEWRNQIKSKFYRSMGLPTVTFGEAGGTESGSKMESFAHQTVWEHDQRFIEKQLWNQLQIKIDLVHPESMSNLLGSDQAKDAGQGLELQQSDLTAGVGR